MAYAYQKAFPFVPAWEGAPPVPGDLLESSGARVFYRVKTMAELVPGELLLLVSRHAHPQPGSGSVVHPWGGQTAQHQS